MTERAAIGLEILYIYIYIYVYNSVLFFFFEKYLLRQLESAAIGSTQKNERHKNWYVVIKTKTRDVFDVGTSPQHSLQYKY